VGRFSLFDDAATLADPINAEWLATRPGTAASQLPIQRNRIFGESRVRGLDLDLAFLPVPQWMLLVSYARMSEAEADQTSGPAVRLVGSPRHSYSVWSKYEFRRGRLKGLKLGGGFNGKTDYLLRPLLNNYAYVEDGFVVFDALVEYSFRLRERWPIRLSLNGKNLLDEEYYAGGASAPGDARRFILSTSLQF
jgi:outer membrane receptor protein involved in Fe transport